MANTNTFLTQSEAAEILRLSPRTLERMRLVGSGPRFVKAGRRVLYNVDLINEWIKTQTFQSTSEAELGAAQ
jgi:hypothetical protein